MVFFTNGILRLGIYVVLSILTFHGSTICILPGVFLIFTGLFYALGFMVGKYEEREIAGSASYNPVPGERVPISAGGGAAAAAPPAAKSGGYDF
ncbi:hypothetical protein TeGR_g11285 [Tetraparma gracilis]|jgi:hypothetical protein|uniref:Uncharacterized protein n=1 Tax=Tetraparma gracilis TaxID=2962635 RepID=A0ABQ6N4J5_9STRA|nr:hypothetical protein TeGR_g11285 [Tetraparma gracilis]